MNIKCDGCEAVFKPGNRPDGHPNGVGMQTRDGKLINLCYNCVCKVGRNPKYLDEIIKYKN